MTPGRGNFAKTGRSIPSPFKQQTSAQVDKMIKDKQARDAAKKEAEKKAASDEISTTLRRALRKAASEANENSARRDSTAIDNRLREAGFNNITAGTKGNEAANETRKKRDNSKIMPTADHTSHVYDQVNKDEKSGKYKRTTKVDAPLKQKVSAEVDAMIKRKKDREINEMGAKSDSTSTANKLQKAGFSLETSGRMGNQAANEKRRQNVSPGGYSNQVDKDPKSGKYKMDFKKQSPAKQCFPSPREKTGNQKANENRQKGYPGDAMAKGPSRDKGNDAANLDRKRQTKYEPGTAGGKVYKGSPAKQCFPTPQEKADNQKKNFENRKKGYPGDAMDKGLGKDAIKKRETKYEPGSQQLGRKVYKDSPAKQLGRQAVTKMGGKKTPVKMKSC